MRKLIIVSIILMTLMSLGGTASAIIENNCWIPDESIVHPAITHEVTVIDVESYTETVVETEAYTIPAVTHQETVVDTPAWTEIVVDHIAYTTPAVMSGWHKVKWEYKSCDKNSTGCNYYGWYKNNGWHYGWYKRVPTDVKCNPNSNGCHQDVITPAVYHPEVNHTVSHAAITHEITVIDTPAIDMPAGTRDIYHPAETHTQIVVDEEAWIEVIPGYYDQTCLDTVGKLDTDGDGIPDVTDSCPFDKLNRCNERAFLGYTFGTSDCNRMAILLAQVPSPRIWYTLEVISWEYKYSIGQMRDYCHRCGANMTPVTDGYFEWNPAD